MKTAGAYVWYDGYFPFQVGPTKEGDKLGVVRLGGHKEFNETATETAIREVFEESSMKIEIIGSPKTFLKSTWENTPIEIRNENAIPPILINGNPDEALSVMFLSYSDHPPTPSSESKGILLLTPGDIQLICLNKITLEEYLKRNGKVIITSDLNSKLILEPYPQLLFLSKLLKDEVEMMENYMGKLN